MAGYLSRRMAEAVSAHVRSTLSRADDRDVLAATIYAQEWRHAGGTNLVRFLVLALDAEMAEEMGGIRLAGQGSNILEWTLTANRPHEERSRSVVLAALAYEDPDETQLREETFRERDNAEPPDPDPDAVSAAERIDDGYRVLRERRR